jgi:hypothetical protein
LVFYSFFVNSVLRRIRCMLGAEGKKGGGEVSAGLQWAVKNLINYSVKIKLAVPLVAPLTGGQGAC